MDGAAAQHWRRNPVQHEGKLEAAVTLQGDENAWQRIPEHTAGGTPLVKKPATLPPRLSASTRPPSAPASASLAARPDVRRSRVYGPGRYEGVLARPHMTHRTHVEGSRLQRPSQRKADGGENRRLVSASYTSAEPRPQPRLRPRSSPTSRRQNLCGQVLHRVASIPKSPTDGERRQVDEGVPKPDLIQRSPTPGMAPRPERIERSPAVAAPAEVARDHARPAPRPTSARPSALSRPPSAKAGPSTATQPPHTVLRKAATLAGSSFRLRPIHGFSTSLAPYGGTPPDSSHLYRREKTLGKGAFGSVALVTSSVTNERAAMKTIDRSKLFTAALKKTVEQEVRILKRLNHDGVIRLFEVIETPRAIHMVMEYSPGGNLQQLVRALKRIGEERAQPLFIQMVDAVDYCHSQRVCHRDLKLENFVLDRSQRRVQLIDFGLSVIWRPEQPLFKSYGTPCYTAPEIMGGHPYDGPKVDVWSLGVALTTMLTGSLPFQAGSAPELKRRVMTGKYHLSESISEAGRDLVRSMLTLAPERRAELRDIRNGRWLAGAAERLPHPPPAKRDDISAETPLDAPTLRQLESLGMATETVEASVRSDAYNHEAACYEMLLSARRAPIQA